MHSSATAIPKEFLIPFPTLCWKDRKEQEGRDVKGGVLTGSALSQVDNAKDFLSMGGLQLVIEGLNSSEASLKENAAFVLGAALSR